jgi:hypothetical protein
MTVGQLYENLATTILKSRTKHAHEDSNFVKTFKNHVSTNTTPYNQLWV